MIHHEMIALHIERRCIALAVYSGLKLHFSDVRELPNNPHQAAASTRRYLAWVVETFEPRAAAIECPKLRPGSQREYLLTVVYSALFGKRLLRLLVRPSTLKAAMGEPPLRNRKEIQELGATLWPKLPGTRNPAAYGPAILGLHIQMLDLFMS